MTSSAHPDTELLERLRLKPGEIIEPVVRSLLQKVKTPLKEHEKASC